MPFGNVKYMCLEIQNDSIVCISVLSVCTYILLLTSFTVQSLGINDVMPSLISIRSDEELHLCLPLL